MKKIITYDTTLRDGSQGENISFTVEDKLAIAQKLDDFGIDFIEGGWPSSNPKDKKFFKLAKKIDFKHSILTAFGSTRKPNTRCENNTNLLALLKADTKVVTIFGKTWQLHIQKIMQNTLSENLLMIDESIKFFKNHDRIVVYDAEHFFDGFKENQEYALETLTAALDSNADYIVLCDTNGGCMPYEIESIVKKVIKLLYKKYNIKKDLLSDKLGIHAHDDLGCATSNSVFAIKNGVKMVQGTINGYGERCGNADLMSIIPIACMKMNYNCNAKKNLSKLVSISRYVSEISNMIPQNNRPFVGVSAFAHKGGIHVNAIAKEPKAYEHIDPKIVGNKRRVLISDLAGKSNIEYKVKELGMNITGSDSKKIISKVKQLEQQGYQFDVADGSFKILMEKITDKYKPIFELESFRVTIEKDKEKECKAHATIKIAVDNKHEITAAEGDGPVSALDNAVRKALGKFFPEIDSMHLVDFKVRVIDGRKGTKSKVRVNIESRDNSQVWKTIGVSEDIIEASWHALFDSFQFKLAQTDMEK